MKRKIFFIIIGGLLLLGLILLLWFWFFGRHNKEEVLPGGELGTSQDAGNGGANSGAGGNGQAPIGSNSSAGGTSGTGGGSGGSGTNGQTPIGGGSYSGVSSSSVSYVPSTYDLPPSGVIWLDGSWNGTSYTGSTSTTGGGGGGSTNNRFTPTAINQLNTVNVSGIGNINEGGTSGTGGSGVNGAVVGALAGLAACTAGLLPGLAGAAIPKGIPVWEPSLELTSNTDTLRENFLNCITRGIARIAIEQITTSVVDWINSGFNGQPSFIQDYEQFFTDVADKSAGEYIQGSGLSFLCSPFQLQVKIAIAQSYANRKSSSAGSCTLSGVTGNIENFLKGNFSDGGWPAFIQFTTQPANNPYAGFVQAQIALNDKVLLDTSNANRNIKDGFIGSTEEYGCKTRTVNGATQKYDCKTRTTTPGSILENALIDTNNQSLMSLNLADNFDEIIGALVQQLLTRTLYSGLSNLSNGGSYGDNFGSTQTRALDSAQSLLTNLQGASQLAQQYGSSQQGSISDIQVAQAQLTNLANCWSTAASSTSLSSGQVAQAQTNAAAANSAIATLETRVAGYNTKIVRANTAVTTIMQLQSSALAATTLAGVQNVQAQFTAAQNSGALISQAAVTSATQDRQTLQGEMSSLNQNTAAQLNQCHAF